MNIVHENDIAAFCRENAVTDLFGGSSVYVIKCVDLPKNKGESRRDKITVSVITTTARWAKKKGGKTCYSFYLVIGFFNRFVNYAWCVLGKTFMQVRMVAQLVSVFEDLIDDFRMLFGV